MKPSPEESIDEAIARNRRDRHTGSVANKANDSQIGGTHYKGGGTLEHWDYAWLKRFDPFQYQITKYVERWRKKNGIEDLRKARHFLDKYIELAEAEHRDQREAKNTEPAGMVGGPTAGYIDQARDEKTSDGPERLDRTR